MVVVAPDILEDVRQLPWFMLAVGLAVGLLLWLYGGRVHRFWLVLCMTLGGGVFGLLFGKDYDIQPLVAGLLMAVAAGALALALARVLLFLVVGAGCVWLAHAVAPSWDEPALCFLVGGLMGVLFYKVWVTALSSLAGTLLIAYSFLGMLNRWRLCDVVAWSNQQTPLLNWACAAFAVLGLLVQLLLERRHAARKRDASAARKDAKESAAAPPPPPPPAPPPPPPTRPWWQVWQTKGGNRAA